MSNRKQKLAHMRAAGYEDDRKKWMRLFTENRIGRAAAEEAWEAGRMKREREAK